MGIEEINEKNINNEISLTQGVDVNMQFIPAKREAADKESTKIVINPNFAIIYDINDGVIRIGDLVFNTNKEGLDAVEEISKITNNQVPQILYDIYNNKFDKVVWTKDNMENNLRKLIGVLDENS